MKTKLLFGALGLAVAFAACTDEDIMEANVNNVAFEGRKVVDLELVDGVGSRLTLENGQPKWEDDDQIGATLVDPTTQWTVDQYGTLGNNRWDYMGNNRFATQGTTVEGAWMFYYPYQPEMSKNRKGLFALKTITEQKYDADASTMYENDFRISPVYFVNAIEGATQTIDIRLNSVYAYGDLKVALPKAAKGAKVSKVLLRYSSAFNDSLLINAEEVAKIASMNYAYTEGAVDETNPNGKTPVALGGGTETYIAWWDCDSVPSSAVQADSALFALEDYDTGETYTTTGLTDYTMAYSSSTANDILIDCKEADAITDTIFTTRVLLPAMELDASQFIKVYVYSDKGVYEATIQPEAGETYYFKRGLTAYLSDVNRVGKNYKDSLLATTLNTGDAPIVETADLVNLIKQATKSMNVQDQLLGDVVIDDAVAEALIANDKVDSLEVSSIDIECTKAQNLSKLVAHGAVVVKSGEITIGEKFEAKQGLTINSGATVNVAKTCTATTPGTTTVKGNLNIANGVTYSSVVTVEEGALVLGTTATARAAAVSNKIIANIPTVKTGSVTINVPVNLTATTWGIADKTKALNITVNDTIYNTGSLTLGKNVSLTNNSVMTISKNNGAIVNNGSSLTVTTNDSTITHKGIELTVDTNNGSIANESSAIADATLGAKLTLTTNGATGVVTTVAYSQTDVTTNNGKIYFKELAFVNTSEKGSHTELGNIIYCIEEDMTAATLSSKLKNSKVSAITIKDATLTFEPNFDNTQLVQLKNAVLEGGAEILANDTVYLHMPIYVEGVDNLVNGTYPVIFTGYENTNDNVDIIVLKDNAKMTVNTVIAGLDMVTLGTKASVLSFAKVYGYNAMSAGSGASWIGSGYEVLTPIELATKLGITLP